MNKTIFLMGIFFIHTISLAQSWSEALQEKASLFDITCQVITEQYDCYVNNSAPRIANPLIKCIPIIDNADSLVDMYAVHNNRISMLPVPLDNKPFYSALYNSGLPSASKIRKEVFLKLEKMIYYLDELSESFGYAVGDVSIKVFEGLRDLKTQEKLFEDKFNEIKVSNPHLTVEEVEIETAKWVSPVKNNVPVHSTGAAIDIRLWNEKTQDFIDLGKFGVIWGENKEVQTFSESITDAQKLNRLFLLLAATKAGLVNYTYEYWHFSCGDRYAAYWLQKDSALRVARYGAV